MSIKNIAVITLQQCKAARNLLEWSQIDLSKNSKVSEPTIANFERGKGNPIHRTLDDIKRAFEEKGIKFINDDESVGVVLLNNIKDKE